jgi:hypothetical protein
MMSGRHYCVAVVIAVFVSSCCFMGPARRMVSSFKEVGSGDVVVVGRVDLSPPLEENEQILLSMAESLRNKIMLLTDDKWRQMKEEPSNAAYAGRIEAPIGEVFFVEIPNKPLYILAGVILMEQNYQGLADKAYLPGGFKIDVRPDDKAIYIGTIRYHRNEFFQITGVDQEDDYKQARTLFEEKFGSTHTLRKAIAVPIKK